MATNEKSDLSTAALALLVEILAARDRANAVRDELKPWIRTVADPFGVWSGLLDSAAADDVRNLAYGVASIQIRALTELTKQSETYSRKIVERLQAAKRPAAARAGADPDRLQVCALHATGEGNALAYRGEFVAPTRITRLPQALVLRAREGTPEFPVAAAFEPRTDVADGARVAVTVPADQWIEAGTYYQAILALPGSDWRIFFKLVGGPGR